MKKRIFAIALCAVIAMTSLTACGKKAPANSSSNITQETSSTVQEEATSQIFNPFSGMPVKDEKSLLNRPVAVMVNNVKAALPQRGIADADIVYELPVEGSITRLMAVFSDYTKLPDIGSVRSARHDYVELITPFQPMYLHVGGSPKGKESIKANKIDDIDGLALAGTAFYQDKQRLKTYSSEHTWFTNLDCLKNGLAKTKYATTLEKPISPIFTFAKPSEDVMTANTGAVATVKASVKMSTSCTATFDYDAQTGLYKKGQYGQPHMDTNKKAPAAVKNVLVMYTNVGLVPNSKNKEIDLSKGTGYYLSNGKRTEVKFSKPSVKDNLKVMDKDGKEITLNAGQTWVCISPDTYKNDIVFA